MDPDLKDAIRVAKLNERELTKDYDRNYRLSIVMGIQNQFKRHKWNGYWDADKKPLNSYPLARGLKYLKDNSDHVYLYINAAYAAKKGK
jgi:hypothetical protein